MRCVRADVSRWRCLLLLEPGRAWGRDKRDSPPAIAKTCRRVERDRGAHVVRVVLVLLPRARPRPALARP